MKRLIKPNSANTVFNVDDLERGLYRIYYILGPTLGAPKFWQDRVIRRIIEKDPRGIVISTATHHKQDLLDFVKSHDRMLHKISIPARSKKLPNLRNWEIHLQEIAASYGAVIAWFPNENGSNPRNCGHYASKPQRDLAALMVKQARGGATLSLVQNLSVGVEEGFPERKDIQEELNYYTFQNFPLHTSYEDVVDHGIELAKKANIMKMVMV